MATVGSMGKVVFNVSSRRIFTFDNYSRSTASKVASHEIMGSKPKLEVIGNESDEITFDILIRKQQNVNPQKKYEELRQMCESGKVFPLILGGKPVSNNHWLLTNVGKSVNFFGKRGEVISMSVSVTLKEYPIEAVQQTEQPKSRLGQIREKIDNYREQSEEFRDRYLDARDVLSDKTGGLL